MAVGKSLETPLHTPTSAGIGSPGVQPSSEAWNWREHASEWELKSLASALGLPNAGTRADLVNVVQKQLQDLAEPAEQLSVSLSKMARIVSHSEKMKLGRGDSVTATKAALFKLQERAAAQAKRVLEVDPFQVMQNRDQGPCVLDLAYLYMDFVKNAFNTMMPLLRGEAIGAIEAGSVASQQLNRCMFLIFKVIGTSTNEGNLYDPRRAGRFLVELGRLRRAWRVNCGTIKGLSTHLDEILEGVDNPSDSGEQTEFESYDPTQIIQLTPYALTELHESYHGPPTHTTAESRDQEPTNVPKSWSEIWRSVSGTSTPQAAMTPFGDEHRDEISDARPSDGDAHPALHASQQGVENAIPLNDAVARLVDQRDREELQRQQGDSVSEVEPSSHGAGTNFTQRALRFLPRGISGAAPPAQSSGHVVDLQELHGVNNNTTSQSEGHRHVNHEGRGEVPASDRHFMDWVNQGQTEDWMRPPPENQDDGHSTEAASEARMHASRLAMSTRVHARLTFNERGQPVRVPAHQPISQARMREATGITRLVTELSTRLRSVSAPLLDTGKSKTKSPNTIKLFEHIARWELLGHSNSEEVAQLGLGKPTLLCERLAVQSAKDGRWCAVLGRSLTVHCMPMQICIMNGLLSETNGEFTVNVAPASMFCTAVTVVLRMVFEAYLKAGGPPKLRVASWWKTLAHLADVLICWSTGSNGISATFPNNGNPGRHEMSDVAAKAILTGFTMERGPAQSSWGKLFAHVAPQLCHDLADAEVPVTVVDSVSGMCFLFARVISDASLRDSRWCEAVHLAQSTIPGKLKQSLVGAAVWAKQVRKTVENASRACDEYMDDPTTSSNNDPVVTGTSFHDRANVRKGVRLGVLLGLTAAFSQVSGVRVKSRSSVRVPTDDDAVEAKGMTTRKSRRTGEDVVDLDPVVASLQDCISALARIGSPLAMIGWALDGGHKGIRGGLSLLGNSRWLSDMQGEFPVYSPAQQIVDMTQLLLHTFAELRPAGSTTANAVNALLTDPKWHKTFSMLQAVTPNMFYFGSSLDLIGASSDVFPHSFKISRLRKDLKRHAQEFQNTSSITLVLDRTSPCPSAWRAINSLCRRALVGRSLNASFEGEDGLGDGVNREAMQILIDTLARGPPSKPEESVLCSIVSDNPSTSSFLTLRPDAPLHAAMFFGKVIGLIISSNVNVVLPVAPWIWSALLGRKGSVTQLSAVDEDFGRTLMSLYEHPISHESNKWVEVSGLTFTRTVNLVNGQMSEFELIPDGRNILVNDHNRKQFVQSYAWNSMELVQGESIDAVAQAARKGLCDVIPAELLSSLSPVDLERLVCGLPRISVEAWKKATIYEPRVSTTDEERRVEWFWEAVTSFASTDQALLLHFWAAYTHLPHSGFDGLNFKIRFDEKLSTDHLPMAQTCFLTLRIPKYTSAEQCSQRLLHAVRTGSSGFGFA